MKTRAHMRWHPSSPTWPYYPIGPGPFLMSRTEESFVLNFSSPQGIIFSNRRETDRKLDSGARSSKGSRGWVSENKCRGVVVAAKARSIMEVHHMLAHPSEDNVERLRRWKPSRWATGSPARRASWQKRNDPPCQK